MSYLLLLFLQEPNHENPLNLDAAAAAVLRDNLKTFQSNVRKAMGGGYVDEWNTYTSRDVFSFSLWNYIDVELWVFYSALVFGRIVHIKSCSSFYFYAHSVFQLSFIQPWARCYLVSMDLNKNGLCFGRDSRQINGSSV